MNDCGNCRHTNHLGLPDWSTMPCAACVMHGADNNPTMWEAKPQINYDRIIGKTPEELAKALVELSDRCPDGVDCDGLPPGSECYECWLDWLKQEAQNDLR